MAEEFTKQTVLDADLEEEMKSSYLDYSMSVIVGVRCRMCVMA